MTSRHSSFTAIYTDGSVDFIHDVASAAYHIPSEPCSWSGRFDHAVSSTTAELSGIHAALLHITTKPPNNWLLATDSRCAVHNILSSKGANPDLVCEIIRLGHLLVSHGSNLRVQWIPSHIGLPGNEMADHLASTALKLPTATLNLPSHSDPRLAIKTWIQHKHPVSSVASDEPPPPACTRGLTRKFASLLHRLRADCAYTQVNLHRIKKTSSPFCEHCDQPETLTHIFFECGHYNTERTVLLASLKSLGVSPTLVDMLFPKGPSSTCIRLRKTVFSFLDACGLLARL